MSLWFAIALPRRGIGRPGGLERGDTAAADRVREIEHRADNHKRELRAALPAAFTTPLEPEDIFQLSLGLDDVLDGAERVSYPIPKESWRQVIPASMGRRA